MILGNYDCDVEIRMSGHEVQVFHRGKLKKQFHEISDDYAFTNAKLYADDLIRKIKKGEHPTGTPAGKQQESE